VAAFVAGPFARSRHTAYPVCSDDGPLGLLHYRDVASVPAASWERVCLRELTTPIDDCLTLGPDDALADALMDLAETPLHRALVLRAGRLEGLLSITDVSRLLEVQRLRVSGLPRSASAVSTVAATRGRA
jgi:CBS domain-containing protein